MRFCTKTLITVLGLTLLFAVGTTYSQLVPPVPERGRTADALKFNNAPFELLLNEYAEKTGRTLLIDPKIPKGGAVTLRSQSRLTIEEHLQAIETVLAMNEIALLPVGDKFLKVVPISKARTEAMPLNMDPATLTETENLVSQLILLKYIDINEAEKAIKSFMHGYGQIHLFERTNSILLTDTASNTTRIMEILNLIDQPVEKLEEPFVIQIVHTKASEIKKKLEQIIAETKKDATGTIPKQKDSGAPGVVLPRTPSSPPLQGVIRAPRQQAAQPTYTETEAVASIIEQAERGIIVGEVKIIDDDRTNKLILITRKENMTFFDKIIQVLDVETAPDVIVKILKLEYATAETVAETLNSLIGKTEKTETVKPGGGADTGDAKTTTLREAVSQAREASPVAEEEKSKLGQLSAANIKILPDKRTNALLIMASKSDLAALEEVIKSMDMMLAQVMIEVVIAQVDLDDSISSGMHWVQRALIVREADKSGAMVPRGGFAGAAGAGRGDFITSLQDPTSLTSLGSWADSGGLTAYFTVFGLNLDGIVKLMKTDSRSKIMSSPRIVTTDNTKATIESSEQRYFLKGSTVDQFGNVRPETEIKDIGLTLEVTPHINQSRNVMMEIIQTVSDIAGSQQIGDQGAWPTTKKRSFTASIQVRHAETIVLGGLVRRSDENKRSGVPILGDIPILGRLFSYKSSGEQRSEVVVFITPYVLETPAEIEERTRQHKEAFHAEGLWQDDWSGSKLAEPAPKKKGSSSKDARTRRNIDVKNNAESHLVDSEVLRYIHLKDQEMEKRLESIDEKVMEMIERTDK